MATSFNERPEWVDVQRTVRIHYEGDDAHVALIGVAKALAAVIAQETKQLEQQIKLDMSQLLGHQQNLPVERRIANGAAH